MSEFDVEREGEEFWETFPVEIVSHICAIDYGAADRLLALLARCCDETEGEIWSIVAACTLCMRGYELKQHEDGWFYHTTPSHNWGCDASAIHERRRRREEG